MSRFVGPRRLLPLLALPVVWACDQAPPPMPGQEKALGPIPQQLCDTRKKSLDRIAESGIFEYDSDGTATIAEEGWMRLAATGQQEQLGSALAIHAACSAEEAPTEQSITIRSETGWTLSSRVVEVGVGVGSLI